jgi:hypothetical protein
MEASSRRYKFRVDRKVIKVKEKDKARGEQEGTVMVQGSRKGHGRRNGIQQEVDRNEAGKKREESSGKSYGDLTERWRLGKKLGTLEWGAVEMAVMGRAGDGWAGRRIHML